MAKFDSTKNAFCKAEKKFVVCHETFFKGHFPKGAFAASFLLNKKSKKSWEIVDFPALMRVPGPSTCSWPVALV